MSVSLITCVTNAGGVGPGHSCLDISGTVYTFEGIDYGGDASAWRTFSLLNYLQQNEHRPVIVQRLIGAVDTAKALKYISSSTANDDDYGGSGVCSSQAASAIEAAWGNDFNTFGVDKPYEIYDLAKTKGIVHSSNMYWPGEANLNILVRTRIKAVLALIDNGWTWSTM
ncbi:hypothetical protein IV417_13075 [Alphaproteobacteria bacterium KMM 3653]|uniref:Uncharacterized protein n=1 Tax=Harenicola maris TaxID=2841044 RepID=A0AAP2G9A7_9RHOB|nr:hypothetical protein [Harenicola maris]